MTVKARVMPVADVFRVSNLLTIYCKLPGLGWFVSFFGCLVEYVILDLGVDGIKSL